MEKVPAYASLFNKVRPDGGRGAGSGGSAKGGEGALAP